MRRTTARPARAIQHFLKSASSSGGLLIAASVLAMVLANSPWADAYNHVLEATIGLSGEGGPFTHTVHYWINDGLMAVFFLLVGLEIKREILVGELSSLRQAALPVIAALGGMAAPALIYLAINAGDAAAARGWAIPAATDIAFALAALAVVGSRLPPSLKVFLTALAIIDDLGAIVIIAIFYSADLSIPALGGAAAALALLAAFNGLGLRRLEPYLAVGLVLWYFVQASGVHATLAGVALAMTIPLGGKPSRGEFDAPLLRLEHALAHLVGFVVLPLFGFANAGLSLAGIGLASLALPIPLGVALGLVLGKPIGVLGACLLAIRTKVGEFPAQAGFGHLFGVSLLCGIGFTMSLFIGGLAFADPALVDEAKLGILAGSLASTALGIAWLRFLPASKAPGQQTNP